MEKKLSWLLALLVSMMSFVMTSCGDEEESNGGNTFYYFGDEKVKLVTKNDKVEVFFYPENEEAIREELSKSNLVLSGVRKYLASSNLDQYTEAGRNLYENLMRGTINGEYKNYKSALKHTVGWCPYFLFADDGTEAVPFMSFLAKPKADVEYHQLVGLAEKYNVIITLKEELSDHTLLYYQFSCTNESSGNNVEMSVKFYNSGLFEWSEPNLGGLGGF